MIRNEQELEYAYETVSKMIRLRDRCAVESLWDPSLREGIALGIENQKRKIEREICEYLAKREAQVSLTPSN